MKKCTTCDQEKLESEFSKNKSCADGYDYYCKICKSIYNKNYRQKNLSARRQYTNERRKTRIDWLSKIKEGSPCIDCGKMYEPYCMDFDHLSGKINSVSRMVLQNKSKQIILDEIKKCDLVCVLCHNKRTHNRISASNKHNKYTLRNIDIINKSKEVPCTICQQKYSSYNMQLDHKNPNDKYKNVSQLKNFKVDTLLLEIQKCQVLCALCHRRKTIWEQRFKLYPSSRPKTTKIKPLSDVTNNIKECGRCRQHLSFEMFHKHNKTKDGFNSWCKDCLNEYKRQKRK